MASKQLNLVTFEDGETRNFGKVARVLTDIPELTGAGYFIVFRIVDGTIIRYVHSDAYASELTKQQAAWGVCEKVRTMIQHERDIVRIKRKINDTLEVISKGVFLTKIMGADKIPSAWAKAWAAIYKEDVRNYEFLSREEKMALRKENKIILKRFEILAREEP
jgi:hypothetical protein